MRRLVDHVERIRDGRVDPRGRPGVDHPHPGTVVVRGNRALGRIAAGVATRELIRVALVVAAALVVQAGGRGRPVALWVIGTAAVPFVAFPLSTSR